MKYSLFFIAPLAATLALGQSTTASYSANVNGDRTANFSTVESGNQKTQITQSINGRQVPMQDTETRVISESPSRKVTEQIVRKYDPNGGLGSTQRIVTEEEKTYNGSRIHATYYQTDVNGRMQEFERRNIESAVNGSSGNKQTEVSRPDLNGSFQTVEKRSETTETSGDNTHSDETTYRRDENGGFSAAARDISDEKKQGQKTMLTSAHYEPRDAQQMQLIGQTVSSTTQRSDGSSVSDVSYFGDTAGDGRAHQRDSKLHLRESQVIELTPGPGGSLTQTVTAQRPTISDPERLGAPRVISQTTCTGKCSASNFGFMH